MMSKLTILSFLLLVACDGSTAKPQPATGTPAGPGAAPTAGPTKPGCPDPNAKGVFYTSKDTAFCATAKIACGSKQKAFNDHCGCGCIDL